MRGHGPSAQQVKRVALPLLSDASFKKNRTRSEREQAKNVALPLLSAVSL